MNPNAAELKYADIRISCPILPKNGQSFVNKNPNQPTAKRSVRAALQSIAASSAVAISHRFLHSRFTAENTARNEEQRLPATPEARVEDFQMLPRRFKTLHGLQ